MHTEKMISQNVEAISFVINSAMSTAQKGSIVKSMDWQPYEDDDGDERVKIIMHVPKSDNPSRKQVEAIVVMQKSIERGLDGVAPPFISWDILADVRNERRAKSKKQKSAKT